MHKYKVRHYVNISLSGNIMGKQILPKVTNTVDPPLIYCIIYLYEIKQRYHENVLFDIADRTIYRETFHFRCEQIDHVFLVLIRYQRTFWVYCNGVRLIKKCGNVLLLIRTTKEICYWKTKITFPTTWYSWIEINILSCGLKLSFETGKD